MELACRAGEVEAPWLETRIDAPCIQLCTVLAHLLAQRSRSVFVGTRATVFDLGEAGLIELEIVESLDVCALRFGRGAEQIVRGALREAMEGIGLAAPEPVAERVVEGWEEVVEALKRVRRIEVRCGRKELGAWFEGSKLVLELPEGRRPEGRELVEAARSLILSRCRALRFVPLILAAWYGIATLVPHELAPLIATLLALPPTYALLRRAGRAVKLTRSKEALERIAAELRHLLEAIEGIRHALASAREAVVALGELGLFALRRRGDGVVLLEKLGT